MVLSVFFQILVNRFQRNEGISPKKKLVRASNLVYTVSILPKYELRLFLVSGHLYINFHGFKSFILVSPDFNVSDYSIFS